MKLSSETMITNQIKCHGSIQTTLEDDVNVPDTKPDIDLIIKQNGCLDLTEIKCELNKCVLRAVCNLSCFMPATMTSARYII